MIENKIDQIKTIFPQAIETTRIHGGDDFAVVEVNQAWMFRFPLNEAARKALCCEIGFLPPFAERAPLPVPKYTYIGKGFAGYQKIEGILLTSDLLRTLDPETRQAIAKQTGEFLSALHTFPLEEARKIGLTEGWGGWREKARQSFGKDVAPLLSAKARRKAHEFLDRFFALEWKAIVIHGDFYPSDHVFFDNKQQRLSGVIDFGDLTIEDAATDFKDLLENCGEGFLQDVLTHYSGEHDAGLHDRINMRMRARPLFDAPYAIEYGFEERLARHLSEIEATFG
jgi:aminoglycoside 2''-phosphotransferase